jgi:hypothetical protein
MNATKIVTLGLKVTVLAIIMVLCLMVAAAVSGVAASAFGDAGAGTEQASAEALPAEAGASFPSLLGVSLVETAVLAAIILRSRGWGWKLVGAIFLAIYGLNTVVAQIESLIFLPGRLPPGTIPQLFAMGAILAGLFSPLAVLILGKMRRPLAPQAPNVRQSLPPGEWAWKLAVIAVAYVTLYFAFGYFVAWKVPEVRAFYGGTDPGSFFAQMAWIASTTPWLFLVQALRAMLWVAFSLPVIHMHKGRPWEIAVTVGLLFAVWMIQLAWPNPYMPEAVARAHLVETVSSNLIFGCLVGWLLSQRHASARARIKYAEGLS